MLSRITLLLITLFWVTMNYLLWRSEFGGREHGSSVPVAAIWQKIITAPNGSGLGIDHHNRQIGHGQWSANIGQEAGARKPATEDLPPEGMIEGPAGYRIDFRGSISLNDIPGRLSFDFDIKLNTNDVWQEFNARLTLHTSVWEIHSRAADQTVRLKMQDENDKSERVFKFAELENPQTLAKVLDLPVPLEIFGAVGLVPKAHGAANLSPGLTWEGRHDWLDVGHTPVRAYRLRARLFDRYEVVVIISQVGEILRVELPDGWVLINDTLTTL